MMIRPHAIVFAALGLGIISGIAHAQGPLQRAGQAIDNAGRTIRRNVEGAIVRGQLTAAEVDLLNRVQSRLVWDKLMLGSALNLTVGPDGSVVLQGAVASDEARKRAVDLVQSTIGVTTVVDQLAVSKTAVTVPAVPLAPAQVIVGPVGTVPPPVETRVVTPPARVVAPGVDITVPGRTVIEKR